MTTKFDRLPADRLEGATEAVNTLMAVAGRKIMTPALGEGLAAWGVKRCKSCKRVKHIEDFGKDKNTFDRLNGQCKQCARERGRVKRSHTPPQETPAGFPRTITEARKGYNPAGLHQRWSQSDHGQERVPEDLPELDPADYARMTRVVNDTLEELGLTKLPPELRQELRHRYAKFCPRCRTVLPVSAYSTSNHTTDRLGSECRRCASNRNNAYRRENLEVYREATRRYRARHPYRHRLSEGFLRATRAGNTAVDFTEEELKAYWETVGIDPGRCYFTGEELTPENFSLDHATPISRGGSHTTDNVVPCTWDANNRKSTMTAEEFLDLLGDKENHHDR